MSYHPMPLAPLLMLVACTSSPHAPYHSVEPAPVQEEESIQTESAPEPSRSIRQKRIQAPVVPAVPAKIKSKADQICPPIEGDTDQQRIIRKLDCLLERDD